MRKEKNKYFTDLNDAWIAYDSGIIKIHIIYMLSFKAKLLKLQWGESYLIEQFRIYLSARN